MYASSDNTPNLDTERRIHTCDRGRHKASFGKNERRNCVATVCVIMLLGGLLILLSTLTAHAQDVEPQGAAAGVNSTKKIIPHGSILVPEDQGEGEGEGEELGASQVLSLTTEAPGCPSIIDTPVCTSDELWTIGSSLNTASELRNPTGKPVSFTFFANKSATPRPTIRGQGTIVVANTPSGQSPVMATLRIAHTVAILETQEIDPATSASYWKQLFTAIVPGTHTERRSPCIDSCDGEFAATCDGMYCESNTDGYTRVSSLVLNSRQFMLPPEHSLIGTHNTESCSGAESVSFSYEFGPIDPIYIAARGGFRVRILLTVLDASETQNTAEWENSCQIGTCNEGNGTKFRGQTLELIRRQHQFSTTDCPVDCDEVEIVSAGLQTDESRCATVTTLNNGADRFSVLRQNTTFDVEGTVACAVPEAGPAEFCKATVRDTTRATGCQVEYHAADAVELLCN